MQVPKLRLKQPEATTPMISEIENSYFKIYKLPSFCVSNKNTLKLYFAKVKISLFRLFRLTLLLD